MSVKIVKYRLNIAKIWRNICEFWNRLQNELSREERLYTRNTHHLLHVCSFKIIFVHVIIYYLSLQKQKDKFCCSSLEKATFYTVNLIVCQ